MRVKSYTTEHARNDLEVIEWLLKAGAISPEDARYMKRYVQNLA
jgi:hypothetical protein